MKVHYPLYHSHSYLWPLVAPLESYEEEMGLWCDVISNHWEPGTALDILDLGTGGGHHLFNLVHQWNGPTAGTGVELSSQMAEQAEELLPHFEFRVEDMTAVRLDRRFHLITVHDSFCYLTRESSVRDLFGTIAHHLDREGLALIKLESVSEGFRGPYRYLTNFEDDKRDVTVTHFEWDPDPDDTSIEVVYVFLECTDDGVTTREERHMLGLFSRQQLLLWLDDAGLKGEFHELGRWDEERENLLLEVRLKGSGSC